MYAYRRLKDLREDSDKKQENIALVLGIARQQYQLYESGKREMPMHHFITLAKIIAFLSTISRGLLILQRGSGNNSPQCKLTRVKRRSDNSIMEELLQPLLYNLLYSRNARILAEKARQHEDDFHLRVRVVVNLRLLYRLGFRRGERAYNPQLHSNILCKKVLPVVHSPYDILTNYFHLSQSHNHKLVPSLP